jgi:hypothetical protein
MKTNKIPYFFLIIIILIATSFSCNLPGQDSPTNQIETGLVQNYQPAISAAAVPKYGLSEEQQTQLSTNGYPDRFTILFFKDTLLDGQIIDIRQESWYYDDVGYEIVFRNGEKFTESTGQPVTSPELGKTAYRPEDFIAGMNLDAVVAASEENGYYREPTDNALIKDGSLVFLKGLTVGFVGDALKYIETLPLGAAGDPANHP